MPELLLAGRIKNKKPVGNYRNDDEYQIQSIYMRGVLLARSLDYRNLQSRT